MSTTLTEALILFLGFFVAGLLIGGRIERHRLAQWWHEQRRIPRPVQVGELRGELTLFEGRGETLGLLRVWPAPDREREH